MYDEHPFVKELHTTSQRSFVPSGDPLKEVLPETPHVVIYMVLYPQHKPLCGHTLKETLETEVHCLHRVGLKYRLHKSEGIVSYLLNVEIWSKCVP